jgi:hypothetical protein
VLIPRNTEVRKSRVGALVATFVATLIAFAAIPAFASATVFVVDGTEDTETKEACETAATECTLRGAIEAVDAGSGNDQIEFSRAVFRASVSGDEIPLTRELPPVTEGTTIKGFADDNGLYFSLFVGVTAPAGKAALTIEADDVTVEDVAFGGGKYGIEVGNTSTGFKAKGDWFGLALNETAASITDAGIFLRPGSDGAEIGEGDERSRNVFTHADYGLRIEGASQTKIRGNYFGVGPIGSTGGALVEGLRITDAPGFPAEGNQIGGKRASIGGTARCEGDCNVVVASSRGISLQGDASKNLGSATGPTTISGNYIGLTAWGTAFARLGGSSGIDAVRSLASEPGPGNVTIGGANPDEANVIDNGELGMVAEGAEGLLVQGNLFGWLPGEKTPGSDPEDAGLVLLDEGVGELPKVLGNTMYLGPNAVGIESFGPGAKIVENTIFDSATGVFAADDDHGIGNQISENVIVDPNLYGVLIENDANSVVGNAIFGAGRSGVFLDRDDVANPWPTSNRIGGDSPGLENLIEGSGENAISVGGEPTTLNEVLGNFGLGNGGRFIVLREHHAGHPPNGEIQPPVLEVVRQSSASGMAKAGAKVRLFGKPSTDLGSLERQIGSATADAGGHWTATFATKMVVGKLVGATQTTAAGTPNGATSEVSAPNAAEADPVTVTPPTGTGAGSTVPAAPAPVKPKAPSVKITKGPKKSTEVTKATFKFVARPAAGAKFECKLDGAKWAKCGSPKTYKKLSVGKHTFRVRATAGRLTGPATKYQFTIKP